MPTNPGSCSVDGATGQAACTLLDALNDATPGRTFELAASPRDCTAASCTDAKYNGKIVMLSRFVALSISLIQKASLLQSSTCSSGTARAWKS